MSQSKDVSSKQEKPVTSGSFETGVDSPISEIGKTVNPGETAQRAIQRPRSLSPSDVAYLQRSIGNRAVSQLLGDTQPAATEPVVIQPKLTVGPARDRYEEEADQVAAQVVSAPPPVLQSSKSSTVNRKEDEDFTLAKNISTFSANTSVSRQASEAQNSAAGFDLDAGQERQIRAGNGGSPLPDSTRSFMESRFGADFSGVRIHTGNESNRLNRQMDAKAFTHSNHIYFGSSGSPSDQRLLAHELTHVVQQGAAGSTTAGASIQRAPKVGLIQRKGVIDWVKSKFGKKENGGTGTAPANGNAPTTGTTAPTGTGPKKTTTTTAPQKDNKPKYKTDTAKELADSVEYEHRLGRYAYNHSKATAAVKKVLDKMVEIMVGDVNAITDQDGAKIGQVKSTFGSDDYNSAGQVGLDFDTIKAVLQQGNLREQMTALMNAMFGTFKDYLARAVKKEKWDELQGKGLNVEKLKRRRKQLKYVPGANDLYRNPYLKYDRKGGSRKQNFGSKMRQDVRGISKRTGSELEQGENPIGLSDREKALQFPKRDTDDDGSGGDQLRWMEGGTKWKINDNNPWVKQAKNVLKMPVVAGPSGTMMRMLQLWEWLNKPADVADWRLAILAWMLTSNDHSFHEMMLAAADYGMPYRSGQEAYMNVAPLTVNELRDKVAKDHLFPHEHEFKRKFEGGALSTIIGDEDAFEDAKDDLDNLDAKEAGALSGPAAAAVQLYTSFGYLILNPILRGGPPRMVEEQILKAIREKDELEDLKDALEDGSLDIKQLIEEARQVAPMLESALTMLPDWSGHLYRGSAYDTTRVYMGDTFTFDKLGSASRKESVAKDFADNYNKGKYKYILELDVTAGKDLSKVSSVQSEDEVVLPPGSKFQITQRDKPTKSEPYYHIHMKQIGRGRAQLDLGERPQPPTVTIAPIVKKTLPVYNQFTPPDMPVGPLMDISDEIERYLDMPDAPGWMEVYVKNDTYPWYAQADDIYAYFGMKKPSKTTVPSAPKKDDAKPVGIILQVYHDPDGALASLKITYADKDLVSDEGELTDDPGWTEIYYRKTGDYYVVKTKELDAFLDQPDPALSGTKPTQSVPQPTQNLPQPTHNIAKPIHDDDDSESSEESSLSHSGSIATPKGGSQNIGFSVPSSKPKKFKAGTYDHKISSFLELPYATTEDGDFDQKKFIWPGDELRVEVTDELAKNGRGKVDLDGDTVYVPLATALAGYLDESESDDDDDFIGQEHFSTEDGGPSHPVSMGSLPESGSPIEDVDALLDDLLKTETPDHLLDDLQEQLGGKSPKSPIMSTIGDDEDVSEEMLKKLLEDLTSEKSAPKSPSWTKTGSEQNVSDDDLLDEMDEILQENFFTEQNESVSTTVSGSGPSKQSGNVFLLPEGGPHLGAKDQNGQSIGNIRPPARIIATGKTKGSGSDALCEFIHDGSHYWCWLDWWGMYFDDAKYPKK